MSFPFFASIRWLANRKDALGAVSPHHPKPYGLGFEFPAFDFGQEGETDLLQAVVVDPGLLSARAFCGLLQQDLAISIVQLGGGEFEAKG